MRSRTLRTVGSLPDISAVVQAARVSYGTGTKTVRRDRELIDYLLRHQHTSPFEQVVITVHAKMPIFVARQWGRHRTARLNEISGRYSEMKDEFYLPDAGRIKPQDKVNRRIPFRKQYLLVELLVPEADVVLTDGSDRVQARGRGEVCLRGGDSPLRLKADFLVSAGLSYDPETYTLRLVDPVVEDLNIANVPEAYNGLLTGPAQRIAKMFVKDIPVYTIRDEGLRNRLTRAFLKRVVIHDGEVEVTLGY